jgi:hypothetical protein
MFDEKTRSMIIDLIGAFAELSNIPITVYGEDDEDKQLSLIAQCQKEHFPAHCQTLWKLSGGEGRCSRNMLERAQEAFDSKQSRVCLCHAGLTTELHPLPIEGGGTLVLLFGAFQDEEQSGKAAPLRAHEALMADIGATPSEAAEIRKLLFDSTLRQSKSKRACLQRSLPLLISRVIQRYVREKRGMHLAFHDVAVHLQSSLAEADELEMELSDNPHVPRQWLQKTARDLSAKIESASAVLHNQMRGAYLPSESRFTKHDLRDVIYQATSLCHALAQKKNIALHTDLRPEAGTIGLWLSIEHIQQAFNNLIHNAIKYSYSGRGYGTRQVAIRGSYHQGGYRVVVGNYGVGILEEEYEEVFKEGYMGKLRQQEYRTGSGQGLPLVKRFVEAHGGTVVVTSKPMGDSPMGDPSATTNRPYLTEFTVWLPLELPAHLKRTKR